MGCAQVTEEVHKKGVVLRFRVAHRSAGEEQHGDDGQQNKQYAGDSDTAKDISLPERTA